MNLILKIYVNSAIPYQLMAYKLKPWQKINSYLVKVKRNDIMNTNPLPRYSYT